MSVDVVKKYLVKYGRDNDVQVFDVSSATVELAAAALGVEPARIAKTLSFYDAGQGCIIVVAAGDVRVDGSKFKKTFGVKAKMLSYDDAEHMTGYAVGGVCPFANPEGAKVYLDESLKRFDTVYPACGSSNSGIELACEDLFKYSHALEWVDVAKQTV